MSAEFSHVMARQHIADGGEAGSCEYIAKGIADSRQWVTPILKPICY
jgi:hypothetical protein